MASRYSRLSGPLPSIVPPREFNGNVATRENGISAASSYSYRPPEPPNIIVPPTSTTDTVIVAPTYHGVGGDEITEADLRVITQTKFTPVDHSTNWKYEHRRFAQKILPFIYLGPWEVLKTQQDFIRNEGISMLLVIRDRTTANAGLMNPKKYAEQLGILYGSIDVQDNQELITAFPHAVKIINDHLINCYRQQVGTAGSNIGSDQTSFRMGKILIYCESGNERSAAVAAAYLLAMYKVTLVSALQLIQAARFCVSFDEGMKNLLKSYEDILLAQRIVHAAQKQTKDAGAEFSQLPLQPNLQVANMTVSFINMSTGRRNGKRGRDDDDDDEMVDDSDRFLGRPTFQPFLQE